MEAKYDKIGQHYNTTRKADRALLARIIAHLDPMPIGQYLDLGCGTGNYTIELHKKGIHLTGVDPSNEMLKIASDKSSEINWQLGCAEAIPAEDESFDGCLAKLTIHHWSDLESGFKEVNRVLKPGGRMVVFTSTPSQMKGYWLNHYFPQMLEDSMEQMPAFDKIQKAIERSSLRYDYRERYLIQPDLQDQFLYAGKHNPSLYLDDQVRRGISSFSSLANAKEVQEGLINLRLDIESGNVHDVIRHYENARGDYLYVVAVKL
ncbi:MAG: ubiquinone/menaquinone biosynthesis C-methylase UbiE [Flavobacteriales bacterium]|jgi:ubiquinone/menaquinone biosynthesis C-methylase UbiE